MPKQFRFTFNDHNFNCNLVSVQCVGETQNGNQCTRNTVIGTNMCWQHLLSTKQLRILPSNIPGAGKGLFALNKQRPLNDIIFRQNEIIGTYIGETLTLEEIDERYTNDVTGPYAFQLQNNVFIDSACNRGYGSLINQGLNNAMNNVEFYNGYETINRRRRGVIKIRALRDIRNHEELYGSYGNDYVFDQGEYTTS